MSNQDDEENNVEEFGSGPFDPNLPSKLEKRASNPNSQLSGIRSPSELGSAMAPINPKRRRRRAKSSKSMESIADGSEFIKIGHKVRDSVTAVAKNIADKVTATMDKIKSKSSKKRSPPKK